MKRSSFLLGTISGLAVVARTDHVFARALAQSPLPGLPGSEDRVFVLVNLAGGNDGLNTVVPFGDATYYRVRPTLAVPPGDVLRLDDRVGFNPALRSLKALYDKGMVAVIQGVGYPDPDFSHFRSTQIWQTAAPATYETTGWLGRVLDDVGPDRDDLFEAVAVARSLPQVLVGENRDVPVVMQLGVYGLLSDRDARLRRAYRSVVRDPRVPFTSPYLAHVLQVEGDAQRQAEELPSLIAGYTPVGSYPATPLGRSLALAAQMIAGRTGTRILYVQQQSYDTHVSQKATHDRLLAEFADAVKAFYDDLAAHGNEKRVLTMTFSEFGRRIAENASGGTDHGEASPVFLIGGGVKGGIYGAYPDLTDTDLGNLKYTTDFRDVYATVIERWLGRRAASVLGGRFPTIPVVA
jgi:uncharacterized protein (DUF1501 family)